LNLSYPLNKATKIQILVDGLDDFFFALSDIKNRPEVFNYLKKYYI